MNLTLITGNSGKAEEVRRYLAVPIEHQEIDLPEIQSLDLGEIVKDKAERAFTKLGQPVLVEDVSLVFHALGQLPGPLIKWFLKELDMEGLCRLVDGKNRRCTATVCYGLHDGGKVRLFSGSMEGLVSDIPRGSNSFGWAPIFVPLSVHLTYAELSNEQQAIISMRRKALKKLRDYLVGSHLI
ncbi:MAG: non-canonical purine NTP pyrophosphatase [Candidatus Paceibacterota bacterium]